MKTIAANLQIGNEVRCGYKRGIILSVRIKGSFICGIMSNTIKPKTDNDIDLGWEQWFKFNKRTEVEILN
jgi:hypothetical protein